MYYIYIYLLYGNKYGNNNNVDKTVQFSDWNTSPCRATGPPLFNPPLQGFEDLFPGGWLMTRPI